MYLSFSIPILCLSFSSRLAGVCVLCVFLQHMQVNKDTSFKYCYPFPEQWGPDYAKAIVLAKFLVYYAIPLVIIGLFYCMIAVHLAYGASVPGEMQGAMRQVNIPTTQFKLYSTASSVR